ncbi:MAG TPA: TolC family protein [Candidatus Acidoferrales bacterium]|nr:TolC family protein [Candidatus Acidoferrales bacterium]
MSSGLSVRWWSILLMAGIFASAGANAEPAGSARAPTPSPHPLTVWVDAALARDPAQELLPALARESQALAQRARSWFSGPPALSLRWQDDTALTDTGLREAEAGVEWPLWWPSVREASRSLAETSASQAALRSRYNRWQVAGVIRERLWSLALADADLAQARAAERSAAQLHEQVVARVRAGDLPHTDQLMSEQEYLARAAERAALEREYDAQRASFQFLVGLAPDLHGLTVESPVQMAVDTHPGLAVLAQEASRAEAEWQKSLATGAGAPIIQVGARRERGSREEEDVNSLGIGVSIPFAAATRADERAAAERALAEARLRWRQGIRDQAVARQEAEAALQSAEESWPLIQRRADLAQRQQDLAQAAFAAGELDLMDLLRIREQTRLAVQEVERQRIRIGWQRARLNQIMGDVP